MLGGESQVAMGEQGGSRAGDQKYNYVGDSSKLGICYVGSWSSYLLALTHFVISLSITESDHNV